MDIDGARDRLLALREEAVARLVELGISREDVVQSAQGANIDDEHDPEGTTIAFERELLGALATSTRSRLGDIDAALARIEAGSYLDCEVCGEAIGEGRLEARPIATRCLRHA